MGLKGQPSGHKHSSSDGQSSPVGITGLSKNRLTNTNSSEVAKGFLLMTRYFLHLYHSSSGTKDERPNMTKDVPTVDYHSGNYMGFGSCEPEKGVKTKYIFISIHHSVML